jgi:hypothetical protein
MVETRNVDSLLPPPKDTVDIKVLTQALQAQTEENAILKTELEAFRVFTQALIR